MHLFSVHQLLCLQFRDRFKEKNGYFFVPADLLISGALFLDG
jgi:hypothetical protein